MVLGTRLRTAALWRQSSSLRNSIQLLPLRPIASSRHTAENFPTRCVSSGSSLSLDSHPQFAETFPHIPVLLEEVLGFFAGQQVKTFVDGTLGAGGHSAAILEAHPETQLFLGLDVDATAHEIAAERLQSAKESQGWGCQLKFARSNYSQIRGAVEDACGGGEYADGILLDIGVSSMQMDTAARGFSFSKDGPLDMRMGISAGASAEQIVNTWPEVELARIFRDYGEERHSRAFASRLVDAREKGAICTTQQLCAALGYVGKSKGKGGKANRIHPATRIFQALRIAVNEELKHLEKAIPESIQCLAPGGRLAVITFHSLEDRIVKQALLAASGKSTAESSPYGVPEKLPVLGKLLTRKPVIPTEDEQNRNSRSRSAKLRVFERACL